MRAWLFVVGSLVLSGAALASDNPWPSFREPFPGPARAIGGYSKGCLQGGVALALDGAGYQVMRPGRRRYFGHPWLVEFVQRLARDLEQRQHSTLLVGDLSQVRGGRSNGGHSSHQTGLDVDLWYFHPKTAFARPLPLKQRERLAARSIVDEESGKILPAWKGKVKDMLELAARDPRVARIFVNPIIKRELCEAPKATRAYLRKVRPWYGHDDHFHVRLHCPPDSVACEAQEPVGEGDGCGALDFWFDEKAQAERRLAQTKYQKNVDEGQGWPAACAPLLE